MEQLQRQSNKVKLKCTATEWDLRTIVHDFGETSEYPFIAEIARVALITPVSNAWPEHGAVLSNELTATLKAQ